ncbi:hypothetical protein Tco_0793055 [Tanacetum coccineum]
MAPEVLRDEASIERLSHYEGVTKVEKYAIDTCRTVNLDDGHGYEQLNRGTTTQVLVHCNPSCVKDEACCSMMRMASFISISPFFSE